MSAELAGFSLVRLDKLSKVAGGSGGGEEIFVISRSLSRAEPLSASLSKLQESQYCTSFFRVCMTSSWYRLFSALSSCLCMPFDIMNFFARRTQYHRLGHGYTRLRHGRIKAKASNPLIPPNGK
jgi:hypothetical protein